MDNRKLLVKVITWRIVSIVLTLGTTYLYSGDIKEATGLTTVLHIVLMIGHFAFEKLWESKSE